MLTGFAIARYRPDAFIVIGGVTGTKQGRIVTLFEGFPAVLGLIIACGLAPRFPQWDRFGSGSTLRMAGVAALAAPLLAESYFFTLLLLYPPAADPPAGRMLPIGNNVLACALLAVLVVGLFGRLVGTLVWACAAYCCLWLPTWSSTVTYWLPLNFSTSATGLADDHVRWAWLAALAACVAVTVIARRLVPISWTIRPAEER